MGEGALLTRGVDFRPFGKFGMGELPVQGHIMHKKKKPKTVLGRGNDRYKGTSACEGHIMHANSGGVGKRMDGGRDVLWIGRRDG